MKTMTTIVSGERGSYFDSTETYCNTCKGKCWHGSDNFATQAAARSMFGILPNRCITNSDGKSRCPYA